MCQCVCVRVYVNGSVVNNETLRTWLSLNVVYVGMSVNVWIIKKTFTLTRHEEHYYGNEISVYSREFCRRIELSH